MSHANNMDHFDSVTLIGKYVVLEPLRQSHLDGLVAAAEDGELWNLWYTNVPRPEEMEEEIDRRLTLADKGSMLPFTARLFDSQTQAGGRIIGMTSYMNIDLTLPRVEIGSTWNAASVHGTGTNPDSKMLLLDYAFSVLHCPAVEFRTHWMNQQSREAINRLGAKQDGILRSHTRAKDGSLRDTVVYSILAHEWPMIEAALRQRLGKGAVTPSLNPAEHSGARSLR